MIIVEPPRKPEFQALREYMEARYPQPVQHEDKEGDNGE